MEFDFIQIFSGTLDECILMGCCSLYQENQKIKFKSKNFLNLIPFTIVINFEKTYNEYDRYIYIKQEDENYFLLGKKVNNLIQTYFNELDLKNIFRDNNYEYSIDENRKNFEEFDKIYRIKIYRRGKNLYKENKNLINEKIFKQEDNILEYLQTIPNPSYNYIKEDVKRYDNIKNIFDIFKRTRLEELNTFVLACLISDIYIFKNRDKINDRELYTLTSLLISEKLIEKFPSEIENFQFFTKNYKVNEISKAQEDICISLEFDLFPPTSISFLEQFYKIYEIKNNDINICNQFACLSCFISDLLIFPQEIIAEGCLYCVYNFEYSNNSVPSISELLISEVSKYKFLFPNGINVSNHKIEKLKKKNEIKYLENDIIFKDENDYQNGKLIGEGQYGQIYKVETKRGDKILKIFKDQENIPRENLRETVILKKLNHENVIKLNEIIYDTGNLVLVMELLDENLYERMERIKIQSNYIKKCFYKICNGFKYLHSIGIIHRDLKAQNILLNFDGTKVKVADFGLSRFGYEGTGKYSNGNVQSAFYRAPEIILCIKEYSDSIDVWSLGVLLYYMSTYDFPFTNKTENIVSLLFDIFSKLGTPKISDTEKSKYQYNKIFETNFSGKKFMKIKDENTLNLLNKIFQIDYKKRIDINDILKDKYFND